ncbi:unnamed protein product [Sphagnum balticum]
MSGFDLKRPLCPESNLQPSEPQTRGRKNTFDSGSKSSNTMYASQMVMPSSGVSTKLEFGALSGMGRIVAEEPTPNFDHNFGVSSPMKSYTPMADALLKRGNMDSFKSFKPLEVQHNSNDVYKPRQELDSKSNAINLQERAVGADYYSK